MPELSLNLDPSGGLWPVIPAAAPTPDEEPAIDFGALLLIQAQPFPPVVPVSLEQPGLGPADAVVPVPSAQPGVIPADPVGLKPNGSEEKAVIPGARYVGRDERPAAPDARVSSEQPGFSPADPVPPVSSEQPGFSAADRVGPKPAGSEETSAAPEARRVLSKQPGLSPADPVPSVSSEQPGFSAADRVGLKPDGSEEKAVAPEVRHVFSKPPSVSPADPVPSVSSEQPGLSPADPVGLKPNGSEKTPGVPDARPVVRAERPVAPEVRHVSSEPPAESPAVLVGPKPADAEDKPTGSNEKPIPATGPTVFSHGSVSQAPQAAQPVTPAVAQTPLQAMVPTTEEGAPVMPRLVEMMRWQAQEGGGQAELRLRPEFLGAVTVSIVVEHGAVKAIVSAETQAALEYLRAESSGLQEALEERGLTLDEFEVREESPLAERRRDADDAPPRKETNPPAPRRRVADADAEAVFNVLM